MVAFLLLVASSFGADWTIDPAHTAVGFNVQHMMISEVEGSFPGVSGTMTFDPAKPTAIDLDVTVDMASVDTSNADRDKHLRSPDFLDVEKHPEMTFSADKIKAKKDGSFTLMGDLTIKGITKPVTFEGSGLDQVVTDPWGNQRVGATATATIQRKAFGVNFSQALDQGGVMVGNDLDLEIKVEFIQSK